jgi:hypothetical protein
MRLELLKGTFAVASLAADESLPAWAAGRELLSITRTRAELSIVCQEHLVPAGIVSKRGWRCLQVAGPLDLSLVGVLVSLAEPLARAGIPIFVISTFDTDYLLIHAGDLGRATEALTRAGHQVGE